MPRSAAETKVDIFDYAATATKILPVLPAAYLLILSLGAVFVISGNDPQGNYKEYFYYILFGSPIVAVLMNFYVPILAICILVFSYSIAWFILIAGDLYPDHGEVSIATGKYLIVLMLFVVDFALSAYFARRKTSRMK